MDNRISVVGHRANWGGTEPFALNRADRRQHVYILGQTGTGKSTLLKNLLIQDIIAGDGCALIDPHGDLAEEILDSLPSSRSNDLVFFNPGDLEYPIAYNVLATDHRDEIHLLTSGIVSAFKSIWSESWGPRMEYLLAASIAALAECYQVTRNITLLGIPKMLVDDDFRAWVVSHVSDPAVRSFWLSEYEHYDRRFRTEIISPVQNKVGQLILSPIRNCIGQVRKSFDLRFIMDRGRIFIANLSKGKLGEETSNLLGAFLISQFEQAAFARAGTPMQQRRPFFLYVDEAHNYATDSFAGMMAESRKYGLAITLLSQQLAQLRQDVRDSVLGNCGTLISFRVGESDAHVLEREFGGEFAASQFTDLDNFQVLVKMLDEGRSRAPFRASTLPPFGQIHGRRERLIAQSRHRYATPRKEVEEKIRRWMRH